MTSRVTPLVVDASVALTWLFTHELTTAADRAANESLLRELENGLMLVPSIWLLEIVNVLARTPRGGVPLDARAVDRFLALLAQLPKLIYPLTADDAFKDIRSVALNYRLSAYDAAYIHVARQARVPLVTLEQRLAGAARAMSVLLWGEA